MIDPGNIVVPAAVQPAVVAKAALTEREAALRRIWDFDREHFGPSAKQDRRGNMLIQLCLMEGIDTRSRIIRTLQPLGLKRGHIANLLKYGDLDHTSAGLWHCGDEERYRLK